MVDGPESPLLEDTVAGAVDYRGLPAKRSTSGGWSSSYFIIGKHGKMIYFLAQFSVWFFDGFKKRLYICRYWSGGEISLLWHRGEPRKLFDWATTTVHGHGCQERKHLVRHHHFTAISRSLCCRFLYGSISHHCHRFSSLHPGLSLSSIFLNYHFYYYYYYYYYYLLLYKYIK